MRDASGNPIDKAEIHLQATDGHKYSATTTSTGQFVFTAIAPGSYMLTATALGKTWTAAEAVEIKDGAALPSSLQFSAQGQELRIIATKAATNNAAKDAASPQASGGEHLSTGEVSSLPLNERDFSKLLLLAARTMTDTNGAANFTQQFAVNGQRGSAAVLRWMGRTQRTRSLAVPHFRISTWMRFRKCNPVQASCRRTSATAPRASPT